MKGFRALLYIVAKLLGDVFSITGGTVGKRVRRRTIGKVMSRWMR